MRRQRSTGRHKLVRLVICGLLASLPACTKNSESVAVRRDLTDADLVPLIDSSGAVFLGDVISRGTRTTAAIPASRLTAIVRVSELADPESLSLIAPGDLVTLRVSDTTSLFENTRYGFLANILALDTGVVVGEVARLDASTSDARASAINRIRTARVAAEDGRLQRHLEDGDVVVLGVVKRLEHWTSETARGSIGRFLRPASPGPSRRSASREGGPLWQAAHVDVRYRWRDGSGGGQGSIPLYFPGSRHVSFADAPRPAIGDSGIFIAHKGTLPSTTRRGGDSTAYFLLHSHDVRTVAESTKVARLVK